MFVNHLGGRPVGKGNQLQFVLDYHHRPLGHAVAYDVEVSSDLMTWRSWDPVTSTEKLDPEAESRQHLAILPDHRPLKTDNFKTDYESKN
jgi:hypothetical protein